MRGGSGCTGRRCWGGRSRRGPSGLARASSHFATGVGDQQATENKGLVVNQKSAPYSGLLVHDNSTTFPRNQPYLRLHHPVAAPHPQRAFQGKTVTFKKSALVKRF